MIAYYSLWGATLALISMIFSIVAIYKESWFRAAYISVEISYAVNTTIMIIFWTFLWSYILKMTDDSVAKMTPEK